MTRPLDDYLSAAGTPEFDGPRYSRAIVLVQSRQLCRPLDNEPEHEIPVGAMVRVEHGTIEGRKATVYTCLTCLDRYLETP